MKNFIAFFMLAVITLFISCSSPSAPPADNSPEQVALVQSVDQVNTPVIVACNYEMTAPVITKVSNSELSAQVYLAQDSEIVVEEADSGGIYDFIKTNWGIIASILFLISELIAGSKLQSNSIFQLIQSLLKKSATKINT